jgi:hypothetical protein
MKILMMNKSSAQIEFLNRFSKINKAINKSSKKMPVSSSRRYTELMMIIKIAIRIV